jgi:hypothetical protein
MASPPAKVSPDMTLNLAATLDVSCYTPGDTFWKAWYIYPANQSASNCTRPVDEEFLSETDQSVVSLSYAPPLPASPGQYRLRLVLTPSDQFHQRGAYETCNTNHYIFDSAPFLVDTPPVGGRCEIFPSSGFRSITRFTLSTIGWTDEADDLPLVYRFSWGRGSSSSYNNTTPMNPLNSWTQSASIPDVLFYESGLITVRVEVNNTLGTLNYAFAEISVNESVTPPNVTEMLQTVRAVLAGGNDFATLNAVIATAGEAAGQGVTIGDPLMDLQR